MKDDTSLRGRILLLVSDGEPHQITSMARALGASRQGVYRALQTMGASVLRKGRGIIQIRRD